MEIQCKGHAKKTGERCKKAATAFSEFCVQHRATVTAATVVELPEMVEGCACGRTEEHGPHEYELPEPTRVFEDGSFIADFGVKPEPEPAKGFAGLKARSQPTPRCTIKSCHMVRGHGGKHENGSQSVATCAAKNCRLPLNHPGEHGQPARERVRIGELTGKL